MAMFLAEVRIVKCSFEYDEFHLMRNRKIKTFSYPAGPCSIDMLSETENLVFQFLLKGKTVLEGKLDLHLEKQEFSDKKLGKVEFSLEIQELFYSKLQHEKKVFQEIERSEKTLIKDDKNLDPLEEPDFYSLFQNNLSDHSLTQYIKYLESIVDGLSAKVKSFEVSRKTKKNNEISLKNNAKSQETSNLNELYEPIGSSSLNNTQLSSYRAELSGLKEKLANTEKRQEELEIENENLKNRIFQLQSEKRDFDLLSKQVQESARLNKEKDEIIKTLKQKFEETKMSQEETIKTYEKTLDDLVLENNTLTHNLNQIKLKFELEKSLSEKNTREKEIVELALHRKETSKISEIQQIEVPNSKAFLVQDLMQQVERLGKINKETVSKLESEVKGYTKKIKELEARVLNYQKSAVREQNCQIRTKLSGNAENSNRTASGLFEKLLKDSGASLQSVKEIDFRSVFENSSIYEHSENLSWKLIEYSKTIYYYQTIINNLVEVMKYLKSENFALREKIFFSQNVLPLYIPFRGDPLDFAIAEYVNNLKNPLKIPFVRQEKGFYLFGTRNIKIKLLNHRPFIYAPEPGMPIEDFALKYTREEFAKLEQFKKQEKTNKISIDSFDPSLLSSISGNKSYLNYHSDESTLKPVVKSAHSRQFSYNPYLNEMQKEEPKLARFTSNEAFNTPKSIVSSHIASEKGFNFISNFHSESSQINSPVSGKYHHSRGLSYNSYGKLYKKS